jgi:hypothetical protein
MAEQELIDASVNNYRHVLVAGAEKDNSEYHRICHGG